MRQRLKRPRLLKLRQEMVRAAAATNMTNVTVMRKKKTECGILQAAEQCLKEQYRNTIEPLENRLKTSRESYGNVMIELKLKEKVRK